MTKYHIKKDGTPGECHAKSNCPLGGASGLENHFTSLKEAQQRADEINAGEFAKNTSERVTSTLVASLTPEDFAKLSRKAQKRKNELKEYASAWVKENYGIEMDIPVEFRENNQMALGRIRAYIEDGVPRADKMVIDPKGLYYSELVGDDSEVKSTIKHELIHYALIKQGNPEYNDGQPAFEKELKKHNVPSSADTPKDKRGTDAKSYGIALYDVWETRNLETGELYATKNYIHSKTGRDEKGVFTAKDGLKPSITKRTSIQIKRIELNPDYKEDK